MIVFMFSLCFLLFLYFYFTVERKQHENVKIGFTQVCYLNFEDEIFIRRGDCKTPTLLNVIIVVIELI